MKSGVTHFRNWLARITLFNMQFITMVVKLQTALKVAGHINSVSLHQSPLEFSDQCATFVKKIKTSSLTYKDQLFTPDTLQ